MYFKDGEEPPLYHQTPNYDETVNVFNIKRNQLETKVIEGYVGKPKRV
jgi:hypothetical protein